MKAHAALVAFIGGLTLLSSLPIAAQTPGTPSAAAAKQPAPKRPAATPARPIWQELTPGQREALGPLADRWETLDGDSKRKWLEVAARYPALAPDGKARLHQRMAEYAKLTPEQRRTARENFRRAYELPAVEREEKLQRYEALPDDKKRELARKAGESSARKPEPPSRPRAAGKSDAAPAR